MAFVRVNPQGWAVNSTLTSAQLNTLDIDHANAVDRSTAGDTVAGVISLSGPQASIEWTTANITGAGSVLQTVSGGRIALGAGNYPAFSVPRTYQRTLPFVMQPGPPSNWTLGGNASTATGGIGITGNCDLTRALVDGSALMAIDIYFAVGLTHTGPPEVMPTLTLFQKGYNQPTASAVCTAMIPTPVSGAAWYNSGSVQSFTLGVPALAIDRTTASYYLQVVDESGATFARAQNIYKSIRLTYVCADMRPA